MDAAADFLSITISEFDKLKQMAEKALAQVDDEAFFHAPDAESNSLAIIVKHVGGNLRSRWTDFLTTDGEKPDRDRDGEFEIRAGDSRAALIQRWEQGWSRVLGSLRGLTPQDLGKTVQIRGKEWVAAAAIQAALSHTAQHVGQIVHLAKHLAGKDWTTLSIPRAQSAQYNRSVQEQARAAPRGEAGRSLSEASLPRTEELRHHWQDEADAAYLYRVLADAEADARRRDVFRRLAAVEDRHVEIWRDLLTKAGAPPGPHSPSGATRLRAALGKLLGSGFLLPLMLREEAREVKGYLGLHRSTPATAPAHGAALVLARESAEHATTLAGLTGASGEPWHRTASGGLLRNVIYGFNDGLTANFGLVAGVFGASSTTSFEPVIVAGVAGLIADALSMGSSGYLAAKSEQEVYAHEIAMEKDEIALMPEVERDELALLYEAKGMAPEHAAALGAQIMEDPRRMLDEHVREELKIGVPDMTPFRQGWITGLATGVGAVIPVLPFFFTQTAAAAWVSLALAMLAHFLVGAARSVFTGRGVLRSGFDMFVVGLGVAVVGYFVGEWIGRVL